MNISASSSSSGTDLRNVLLGVLLAAVALAYFYAADNFFLSTRFMSPIFQYLLMLQDSTTAWLTFAAILLAAAWRDPAPFLKVVEFLTQHVRLLALVTVALLAICAVFVYHNNPFSMDEYAAVFQAKIFAEGRLTTTLPPSAVDWLIPPGFNGEFILASRSTGQAMGVYWPGFALLLAPFELVHMPWLCNPCLAGVSLLLIHRITLDITSDRRSAGWAVFFTLASGAFIANAISYYSMQAHLTANLLFAYLLLKPSPWRALSAGVVGSFALLLHNPFPHALFAIPWILALARSSQAPKLLLCVGLGYTPLLLLVGVGWLHLRTNVALSTESIGAFGNSVVSAFSFPDKGMLNMRVAALVKMWIWAVPGLFLLAALGRLRRGGDPRVRLLTQSAVVTFVGYLFVIYDQGHGWGYRYFHSAWGVVPILAACAMTAKPASDGRLAAFAGAAATLSLLLVVPLQLMQIDHVIARHSSQLPAAHRPGNNVYFIHPGGFYIGDLVQVDPFLRDADLLLYSQGPAMDGKLLQQNWPAARLIDRGYGVEEWNLGAVDVRRPLSIDHGGREFVLKYSAAPSSADAR